MKEGSIYFVIKFPKPWPINRNMDMMNKVEGNTNVQIIAHSDGHLSFFLKENEKVVIEKHFQKISIKNEGRAIMCIIWKDNEAKMSLNGEELAAFGEEKSTLVLKEKEREGKVEELVNLPNPNIIEDNMERLFIETIIDIIDKLKNDKKYDIIKASGLLRLLLLDKEPLIYKVNKKYKTKLEFVVIDYKEKLPIESDLELQITNLNPSNIPGAKTAIITLKEFLSINCIKYGGTDITVRELIKYCAHIKGGIHAGKPEDTIDETLVAIDENLRMIEEESSIILLKGILQIVLNGLKPLVKEISSKI